MSLLEKLFEKHGYPPELILNIDESMVEDGDDKLKVITGSKKRVVEKINLKDEHITLVICIAASGFLFKPLLILPLKNQPDLPGDVTAKFMVSGQDAGWITKQTYKDLCLNYIIPTISEIRRSNSFEETRQALFITDGHSTRDDDELNGAFKGNFIDVGCMLGKSSSICQPLDLGIFGEFKRCLKTSHTNADKGDRCERQAKLLIRCLLALQVASCQIHIGPAFSRAGLFPFNKEAPFKSELVCDAIDTINTSIPSKPTKNRPRISGRILTNNEALPALTYLPVNPPQQPISYVKASVPMITEN